MRSTARTTTEAHVRLEAAAFDNATTNTHITTKSKSKRKTKGRNAKKRKKKHLTGLPNCRNCQRPKFDTQTK